MAHERQHTVAGDVEVRGIGVHSGETAILTVRPAPEASGVVFVRTDVEDAPVIPACLDHVTRTELGVALGADGVEVLTVEHVLAALGAAGVDNARLELHGPEVPILDGSFSPYLEALGRVGRTAQSLPAEVIRVSEPLTVGADPEASYVVLPRDGLLISATIEFDHAAIGLQHGAFPIDRDSFAREPKVRAAWRRGPRWKTRLCSPRTA